MYTSAKSRALSVGEFVNRADAIRLDNFWDHRRVAQIGMVLSTLRRVFVHVGPQMMCSCGYIYAEQS